MILYQNTFIYFFQEHRLSHSKEKCLSHSTLLEKCHSTTHSTEKEWQEWESQQAAERRREAPEEAAEGDTLRGVWKGDQGQEESREGGIRLVEANQGHEKKEEPVKRSGETEHKETDSSRLGDRDEGEHPEMGEEKLFEEGPASRVGQAWERGELPAELTILEKVQVSVYRGDFKNQKKKAWSAYQYMKLLHFQEFWRRQRAYEMTRHRAGPPLTVPRFPPNPQPRAPLGVPVGTMIGSKGTCGARARQAKAK